MPAKRAASLNSVFHVAKVPRKILNLARGLVTGVLQRRGLPALLAANGDKMTSAGQGTLQDLQDLRGPALSSVEVPTVREPGGHKRREG